MFYRLWDLVYSKTFRIIAATLLAAATVAAVTTLALRFEPSTPVEEAVIPASQSPGASACEVAIAEITEMIDAAPSIQLLQPNQRERIVDWYATAARECTYAEFVDVDRDVVTPFTAGASLFATLDDGLYLDSTDAANADEADATAGGGR